MAYARKFLSTLNTYPDKYQAFETQPLLRVPLTQKFRELRTARRASAKCKHNLNISKALN